MNQNSNHFSNLLIDKLLSHKVQIIDLLARHSNEKDAPHHFHNLLLAASPNNQERSPEYNDLLQQATMESVLQAALKALSLGLSLNPENGQAYLSPMVKPTLYSDDVIKAELTLGTQGLRLLALQSQQIKKLGFTVVRQGQLVHYDPVKGSQFNFAMGFDNQPIVGYYAYVKLKSGYSADLFLTKEQVTNWARENSAEYSRLGGFWERDFDYMALKHTLRTMLNQHLPFVSSVFKDTRQEILDVQLNRVLPKESTSDIAAATKPYTAATQEQGSTIHENTAENGAEAKEAQPEKKKRTRKANKKFPVTDQILHNLATNIAKGIEEWQAVIESGAYDITPDLLEKLKELVVVKTKELEEAQAEAQAKNATQQAEPENTTDTQETNADLTATEQAEREAVEKAAQQVAQAEQEAAQVAAEAARLKEEREQAEREAAQAADKAQREAEELRLKAEQEAAAQAAEAARLQAEREAEEKAQREAEAARLQAEREAEEKAQREAEAAKKAAEEREAEELRLKAEQEAAAQAAEAARLQAEQAEREATQAAEKAQREAEEARLKAEQEAAAQAETAILGLLGTSGALPTTPAPTEADNGNSDMPDFGQLINSATNQNPTTQQQQGDDEPIDESKLPPLPRREWNYGQS